MRGLADRRGSPANPGVRARRRLDGPTRLPSPMRRAPRRDTMAGRSPRERCRLAPQRRRLRREGSAVMRAVPRDTVRHRTTAHCCRDVARLRTAPRLPGASIDIRGARHAHARRRAPTGLRQPPPTLRARKASQRPVARHTRNIDGMDTSCTCRLRVAKTVANASGVFALSVSPHPRHNGLCSTRRSVLPSAAAPLTFSGARDCRPLRDPASVLRGRRSWRAEAAPVGRAVPSPARRVRECRDRRSARRRPPRRWNPDQVLPDRPRPVCTRSPARVCRPRGVEGHAVATR